MTSGCIGHVYFCFLSCSCSCSVSSVAPEFAGASEGVCWCSPCERFGSVASTCAIAHVANKIVQLKIRIRFCMSIL